MPAAEIARRVGVSPTYIWIVEHARPRKGGEPSRPSEDVLRRWANALRMDERYARQILRLAGYEVESSSPSSPLPRRLMRLAASPPPGRPMMESLFAAAPLPEAPKDLRAAVLAEEMHEVLQRAEEEGRLEETAGLLEEYLAFLRHRLEGSHTVESE